LTGLSFFTDNNTKLFRIFQYPVFASSYASDFCENSPI